MITNLCLRNFKKHEALDVQFTDGLNLITGPNWAGKTTVLHGIMFALGGASQVPGAPARRGTNTGFLVSMDFFVGQQLHTVERKKTSANLYCGKELIASGTSPVNTKIEELLGMPMRRFRQLRYAEQKETHALLTLGATELHKILDEITKAEDVTRAIDRLREVITAENARVETIPEEDSDAMRVEADDAACTTWRAKEALARHAADVYKRQIKALVLYTRRRLDVNDRPRSSTAAAGARCSPAGPATGCCAASRRPGEALFPLR